MNIKNKKNKFIVVEGLDGSGKTSIIQKVKNILYKHKIFNVIYTREPGGTKLGEIIRYLIKKENQKKSLDKYAELLMIYASRAQLINNVIKPSLKKGNWVLSDRYYLSSIVYQGIGENIDINLIKMLQDIVVNIYTPDLTIYLDINPVIAMNRIKHQRIDLDKFEKKSVKFFEKIRRYYKKIIKNEKNTITIDANQCFIEVVMEVEKNLERWIKSINI